MAVPSVPETAGLAFQLRIGAVGFTSTVSVAVVSALISPSASITVPVAVRTKSVALAGVTVMLDDQPFTSTMSLMPVER
jgi:hypothetical protein